VIAGVATVATETFPNPECPCGAEQSDPDRLYCDDCIESMAEDMARDLSCSGGGEA